MHLHSARATCLRCTWTATANNAQGLAAQHENRTNHPIEVVLTYRSGDTRTTRRRASDPALPFDKGEN